MVLNTIRDADLKNKRVLIRVDFNVPVKDGKVTDATRILAALPTINYILEQPGASLVVMSHFGRPKGKKNPDFSMVPVGKKFEELLGRPVKVAPDVIGDEVEKEVKALKPGEVLLLENCRFYSQEEANDPEFAKTLASYGDVYVSSLRRKSSSWLHFLRTQRSLSWQSLVVQRYPPRSQSLSLW